MISSLYSYREMLERLAEESGIATPSAEDLVRMSDLITMQPNLNIPLYIVAPGERRDKVVKEVNRPTFARLSPPISQLRFNRPPVHRIPDSPGASSASVRRRQRRDRLTGEEGEFGAGSDRPAPPRSRRRDAGTGEAARGDAARGVTARP